MSLSGTVKSVYDCTACLQVRQLPADVYLLVDLRVADDDCAVVTGRREQWVALVVADFTDRLAVMSAETNTNILSNSQLNNALVCYVL